MCILYLFFQKQILEKNLCYYPIGQGWMRKLKWFEKTKYFLKSWEWMTNGNIVDIRKLALSSFKALFFLNSFTEITTHIPTIHPCKVYNLMFLEYAQICVTITTVTFRTFSSLQKWTPYPLVITLLTPHLQIPKPNH